MKQRFESEAEYRRFKRGLRRERRRIYWRAVLSGIKRLLWPSKKVLLQEKKKTESLLNADLGDEIVLKIVFDLGDSLIKRVIQPLVDKKAFCEAGLQVGRKSFGLDERKIDAGKKIKGKANANKKNPKLVGGIFARMLFELGSG